ncbi:AraC family transcriptional regulator [Algibacter amylolyticus]|uniref:AraC family transcriptional regulator n=1 Tax=Algibacter amylolyticus TaxID=1608400 RepID=A0A5M7B695_9FLAO|nr:AraC family transcriptional regulator [Algibacter amylolyticus]KAA5823767.1 AraC family transcriptional regulator [Algibacter amylolyticus]MBB5267940.1 AraC-like DNA-binding protein [Algibacter amylolyticus]TSJ74255.1 AraC family transcriptional regulator [Algibacter amylolyticus]
MEAVLEQIELGKKQSILAFEYNAPHFDTPWHFHPQHELTYIEESVGTKYIGDYVGFYEPGELVLLRSNLPHCWKNHSDASKQSKSIVIQWNKGVYAKVPELQPLFSMLTSASRGVIFDKEDAALFLPRIKKMSQLDSHQLYIELLNLLSDLSECDYTTLSNAHFIDDLPIEFGSRMSKIHDFIEKRFHEKIYLKELADLVSMSEQSFSRFFSKMMGRPFFTFLNEYRINIASRMLIDTDLTIAQIGYACGYESLPFFHKQFQKFMHVSPLKFRKKHATI